jgi:hypothetical protein
MHTGQIRKGLRPDWEPLVTLVGRDIVPGFMWMFALELDDGAIVQAYKNIATRRYLHVAEDGRAFAYEKTDHWREITAGEAVREAFAGWEDTTPGQRDPDAVRALLERHGDTDSVEAAAPASGD